MRQCEYIMNLYSTLPCNGMYITTKNCKRNEQKYRFIQGCRTSRLLSEFGRSDQAMSKKQEATSAEAERVEVGSPSLKINPNWRVWSLVGYTDCWISKFQCQMSNLIELISLNAHLVPKRLESISRETLGHPVWYVVSRGDLLEAELSWSYIVSNKVIYRTSICLEALWWTRFFDKATAPWLSL